MRFSQVRRISPRMLVMAVVLGLFAPLAGPLTSASAQTEDPAEERVRLGTACFAQMDERVDITPDNPEGSPRLDLPTCDEYRVVLERDGMDVAIQALELELDLRRLRLEAGLDGDYTPEEVKASTHLRSEFSPETVERMRSIQYMEVVVPGGDYDADYDRSIQLRGGDCRWDETSDTAVCVFPADPAAAGGARHPTVAECAADLSPTAFTAVSQGAYIESRTLRERLEDDGGVVVRNTAVTYGAGAGTAGAIKAASALKVAGMAATIPGLGWGIAGVALLVGGATWFWTNRSAAGDVEDLLRQPGVTREVEDYAVCLVFTSLDTTRDSLPAWRWRQATDLSDRLSGISDAGSTFLGFFASLLFTLSSTLWGWLIDLLREGTSLDVLSGRAVQVNELFDLVTGGLRDSGLPVIALIFTLVAAVGLLMRGRGVNAVRTFFMAAVPLAMLLGLANLTQIQYLPLDSAVPHLAGRPIPVNVDFEAGVPRGSPGWIGVRGAALTQTISQNLLSGFGRVSIGANTLESVLGEDNTACSAYVKTLYSHVDGTSLNRVLFGSGNSETMAHAGSSDIVGMLWQAGFISPWTVAQYGSLEEGRHIYCFDLERRAAVPPAEQQALLTEAFGGDVTFHLDVFSQFGDVEKQDAKLFAWAACRPDGSGGMNPNPEWQKIASVSTEACEGWFLAGDTQLIEALTVRNRSDLNAKASAAASAGSGGGGYATVLAFWGGDGGQRIGQGILIAAVSGIYMYALGGIAIGSILAQYGLFILLALLPATLVLLAFPGPDGRRNTGGVRLLKLTGAMFFAKLLLDLVLATLLQLISLLTGLSGSISLDSGISAALVPLAALLILRKILQTAGVGNITSLTGAASLTANIAAASTRDQKLSSTVSGSFGQEGRELRRAGRFASKAALTPKRWLDRRIQRGHYRASKNSAARKRRMEKFENRTKPRIEAASQRRLQGGAMREAAARSHELGEGTAAAAAELEAPMDDDLAVAAGQRQAAHQRAAAQIVKNTTAQHALANPGASSEDLKQVAEKREEELGEVSDEIDAALVGKMASRDTLVDQVRDLQREIDRRPPSASRSNELTALKSALSEVEGEVSQLLESFAKSMGDQLKESLGGFAKEFSDAEASYGRRLRKGPALSANIPPQLT